MPYPSPPWTNEPTYTGEFILSEASDGLSRDQVTVATDPTLKAGTVLGCSSIGSLSATADALGTNTGNPTFGAITAAGPAEPGVFDLVMGSATEFVVNAPDGGEIGHGALGTAFAAGGLGFTLTAGETPCVADDSFAITVNAGEPSDQFVRLNPTAFDGSQNASAVWLGPGTATGAATANQTVVIARQAQLKSGLLDWGSCTSLQIAAATAQLARREIILR